MAQMKEQHKNKADVWDSFTVPWPGKFHGMTWEPGIDGLLYQAGGQSSLFLHIAESLDSLKSK